MLQLAVLLAVLLWTDKGSGDDSPGTNSRRTRPRDVVVECFDPAHLALSFTDRVQAAQSDATRCAGSDALEADIKVKDRAVDICIAQPSH